MSTMCESSGEELITVRVSKDGTSRSYHVSPYMPVYDFLSEVYGGGKVQEQCFLKFKTSVLNSSGQRTRTLRDYGIGDDARLTLLVGGLRGGMMKSVSDAVSLLRVYMHVNSYMVPWLSSRLHSHVYRHILCIILLIM